MSQNNWTRKSEEVKKETESEYVSPVTVLSNYSSIIPEMEHSLLRPDPQYKDQTRLDHKKTSAIQFISFLGSLF